MYIVVNNGEEAVGLQEKRYTQGEYFLCQIEMSHRLITEMLAEVANALIRFPFFSALFDNFQTIKFVEMCLQEISNNAMKCQIKIKITFMKIHYKKNK